MHQRSLIIPPMSNTPLECLELYKTRISSSLSVVSGSPCLSFFHHTGLSTETYGRIQKQKLLFTCLCFQPEGCDIFHYNLMKVSFSVFSLLYAVYILNSSKDSCDNALGIFIPVDNQRCLDSMTSCSQEFQHQLPKLLKFTTRTEAVGTFIQKPTSKNSRVLQVPTSYICTLLRFLISIHTAYH